MASRTRRPAAPFLVAALTAGLVMGCSGIAPGTSDRAPTPPASVGGAPPPTTTPSASTPSEPGAAPPAASLAAEGGDPVIGQLGTYIWHETGSDAPWLPGAPITVGAGEPLVVELDPVVPVAAWSARVVPAASGGPDGAVPLGEGADVPAFDGPGPGDWTIEVSLTFADDLGEAHYFWAVTVPG
jgi:hypothetical protein